MSTLPNLATTDAAPRIFSDELIADLQRLQKAAQKISSILDLDQLIDSVVKEVTGPPFGCLEASIYLHDEIRGEMVLTGVNGCDLHCKGHRLKVGQQGMVGHVAATGQVRYAPDVRKDQYYISCGHGTLSEVAIPLLVGRDVEVMEERLAVAAVTHQAIDRVGRDVLDASLHGSTAAFHIDSAGHGSLLWLEAIGASASSRSKPSTLVT